MNCKYKQECPNHSEYCDDPIDFARCTSFLIKELDKTRKERDLLLAYVMGVEKVKIQKIKKG